LDASSKPAILAVAGPTATGKTALSVFLAERLGGEIISADSMQVYRGLTVGTAKATPAERHGIPHYGIDILSPEVPYSVADFTAMATAAAQEIAAKGHLPIVAGGTGLYLESFLRGVRFAPDKADSALRTALADELAARGPEQMYQELAAVDPAAAAATHPHNTVRVLRALEHYRATGRTITEQKKESLPDEPPYRALIFGLDYPVRAVLYEKIDRRVDAMLAAGLLREAEFVFQNRETFRTAAQAIGYKELFPYFAGEEGLAPCVEKLKQASRNYAKRQLTWFRRMKEIVWLDAGAPGLAEEALAKAQDFWKGASAQ
jgi:tRNA dimethylallyltransferase